MNKSFLTHCFSKILLQTKKGLSKNGSQRLLKLVVIGVLSIQLFVPIYPVIAETTQSTMATTEKTQAESSTETSQTTASSEPEETSESATDSSIVTSTTDSIQETTASEVESSETTESNEDTINLAQLQTDLLNRIAAFGDVTGTTVTVDNQTITIDLSTTLSEQAAEIKKAITPLIPEGYSAKIMAKSAEEVGFWTPGSNVDIAANKGTYGSTGLTDYIDKDDPWVGNPDTANKLQVQAKGIFGVDALTGVKWYISDNVLHLGPGTTGKAGKTPFPNTTNVKVGVSPWYQYKDKFTSISIDGAITLNAASTYLFSQLDNITQISGAENLNFSVVSDATGMFQNTSSLTKMPNTGKWNLSAAGSASSMFANSAIQSLDVEKWGMEKATSFASMFNSAKYLTEIKNITSWTPGVLTNTYAMFNNAEKLNDLDLSNFITTNVNSMSYMFGGTKALTNLNLGTWETDSVNDMSYMFSGATGLTTLDVSNWKTGNVTNMSYMFNGAIGLRALDVSNFETGNVTNMAGMFKDTSNVQSLTLGNALNNSATSWNTTNVANMTNMLSGMTGLKVITFGKNFSTANVTNKSVALPNTTSTIKWKNVDALNGGTLAVPKGNQSLTAYASVVADTYVLTPDKSIGIDVLVQDSLGNSLSNVEITLYKEDGSAVATVKTNIDGKASFAPQPYGKYSVKQVTDLANYSEPAAEQIELSSTTTDGTNNVTLINIFKPTLPLTGSTDRLWLGTLAGLMIIIGGSAIVIYEKW
ncbi:BspA family leucine-rich repeat surface protein [Enterococcus songbeiensis]|uniref:BspA family leucine-rich repeat surface protein n=1 Tax=Enterococcus songbeiensis TaxID=2559927 RepID=UPI0010F468EC|nr:BspA family leucine-rich repeat surface protein [Enterococcus songbeiensis]